MHDYKTDIYYHKTNAYHRYYRSFKWFIYRCVTSVGTAKNDICNLIIAFKEIILGKVLHRARIWQQFSVTSSKIMFCHHFYSHRTLQMGNTNAPLDKIQWNLTLLDFPISVYLLSLKPLYIDKYSFESARSL